MAMTVCTAQEILAYRACPLQYAYRYRGGVHASVPRPALPILREVSLEAVREYHRRRALDMDRVKGRLSRALSAAGATPDAREMVLTEVLATLDDYTRQVVAFARNDYEWGRSLALRSTGFTLLSKAEALWWDGDVLVESAWDILKPEDEALQFRAAIIHASLRSHFAAAAIRHEIVTLRPRVRVDDVDLDEVSYRRALKRIPALLEGMSDRASWMSSPSSQCCWCELSQSCTAAEPLPEWEAAANV